MASSICLVFLLSVWSFFYEVTTTYLSSFYLFGLSSICLVFLLWGNFNIPQFFLFVWSFFYLLFFLLWGNCNIPQFFLFVCSFFLRVSLWEFPQLLFIYSLFIYSFFYFTWRIIDILDGKNFHFSTLGLQWWFLQLFVAPAMSVLALVFNVYHFLVVFYMYYCRPAVLDVFFAFCTDDDLSFLEDVKLMWIDTYYVWRCNWHSTELSMIT